MSRAKRSYSSNVTSYFDSANDGTDTSCTGQAGIEAAYTGDAAHAKTARRHHHHLRTARAVPEHRPRFDRAGAIRVSRSHAELRQTIRRQRPVHAIGELSQVRFEVRRVPRGAAIWIRLPPGEILFWGVVHTPPGLPRTCRD